MRAAGMRDAALAVVLMPTVSRYMTRQPWTISSSRSLGEAHALMTAHGIRHLPVVDDGALVGIVSERDLHLFEALTAMPSAHVREAMTTEVFAVSPHEAVDQAVRTMGERKYGSVVVVAATGAVEGIFTSVDACRALADILDRATA